jgi:predicted RNA binding protein YcfA (HicA-like mRNA interferase family)
MSEPIPPETQALIQQFKKEDPGWQNKTAKSKEVKVPKIGNADKAIQLAISKGYYVQTGGGVHGIHIIDQDGKYITAIPKHGNRNLATGTWRAILKQLGF